MDGPSAECGVYFVPGRHHVEPGPYRVRTAVGDAVAEGTLTVGNWRGGSGVRRGGRR